MAATALVLLAFGAYGFFELGRFLDMEEPVQKADAIFVLAGSRLERPLEAADLYLAGYAPLIVMTHQMPEVAVLDLSKRGVRIPYDEDLARDVLVRVGVPDAAILIPDRVHNNTAQEAQTLRALATGRGWRRVIVVSSKYHLRRAQFAMRREMGGANLQIIMHGSRYDPSNPGRWWTSRSDVRSMLSEVPKLVAYMLGLGA